jgi:lipopolysaccharide export system protein LptA
MFHPVLPPQPPPNLVSSKPVSDLASTAVIQVKNDQQKLIIDGKNQQGRYQSTTKPVNDSPLSRLENSGWEFSIIQGQKRKIIHIIAGQQVLTGTSTPPVEKNYVNLQESGGKVDLLVGEKTPSLPVQNLIEFKLRNPQNQENQESKPGNLQVPPLPQISEAKKISPQKTRIVEVIADRQEYDQERRIVTAEGNVVVRFDGTVIDADTLHINLDNLMAVGEGNVALTRGNQIFQGQRFTYNFIQDSGDLENGKGELYIPTTATDFAFSPTLPTDITAGGVPSRPLSYRLRANQPLTGVNSPGGIEFGVSGQSDARNVSVPKSGGVLKRLRFEAQYIEFYPRGFQAQDVRITNDPFSPPELEIRAAKVTVTREAPLIDRVTTQGQRLVFDQKVVVPIPVNSRKIDRRPRQVNPTIVSVGFDNGKRGGLFIERAFEPINNDQTRWTITPQFYVQRAVENGGNVANLFGVNTKLNAVLSPKTVVEGTGELTSFDFDQVEDTLRGSLRLRQSLGNVKPYTLSLESSYRDRLYNGSLGYQTVQSSVGGIITSPIIPLGKSGINISYQGGAQYINSNTDRQDLLSPLRKNDRISLGRFQGSVALSSRIKLWEGKPLPATAKEGLKYTSNPVVPYLQAIAGITGTTSYYSSGDNQGTVTGTIGLIGQIGHFSRPFLDYTGFNVSYSQGTNSGLSPFLFDRSVDNKVLSAGISQQVYGPIRLGLQTSINLDTSKEISTDYTLEYSRRTHGITLRYNPVLQLGGFSIRISDFNWTGGTDPFANGQVKPVVGGVVREEN